MARWFKEFPINLRNGTDRIRSASESGSQPRDNKAGLVGGTGTKVTASKAGQRKNSSSTEFGGSSGGSSGGVGSLLSGRNRKNSGAELSCRNGTGSPRDGKVRDGLLSGKKRNLKAEVPLEEQHRPLHKSPSAHSYMSRLIRVDAQDKSPNFSSSSSVTAATAAPGAEKPSPDRRTETVLILEDYADPFDAQKSSERRGGAEPAGENDGYVEPYDAQQMITEIRRRGSKDLLKVCMLMEAPPGQTHEGPGLGPPPEPEPPWERRKEPVVRSLSAQPDSGGGPPRDEASPHASLGRQQHHRQQSWTQKILGASLPSLPPAPQAPPACWVDPFLPLEEQSWYHGCVSRQEAELQLQPCKEASFLVRNSESDSSKYSIALKTSQSCVHIMVARTKERGFTLDQSRCVFPSIPEVVHHYCSQRLPFTGAEHMTLLHPVPRLP